MVTQKLNYLRVVMVSFLLAMAFFVFDVKVALAHYPHDDIFAVEISPNYEQDLTLLINVRGNLLKSQDGGKSWQTIVNGLDHKHELSALDISSESSNIVFLSTLGDGIYKSENGGDAWKKVNQGLENLNINLVAIAPNSTDLVFAAGTESGLYKTENSGASWEQIIAGDNKITAIAFAPDGEDKIIVGDNRGNFLLSQDLGTSWQHLTTLENTGAIKALAISPNFTSDLTFWVGTEQQGIWQTVDGGISFKQVNNGIGNFSIVSLATSPDYQNDTTIFAATWHQGVFRSNDGGNSWQKYRQGLTKDSQADRANFKRPHFSNLSVSPTYSRDKTVFAAGFDGLFKSTDGGSVWSEVSTLSPKIIVGLGLSPDYYHDSTLAITTYLGGAYISHDKGLTWSTINRGLEKDNWLKRSVKKILHQHYVARLFGLDFSPNYGQDKTIFSPSWKHFLKSTNRGQQWQQIPITKKPSVFSRSIKYSMAISPNFASDGTIYLGSMQGTGQDFILKSTDGGLNFSIVGNVNNQPIVYLVISPDFATDNTLYAGVKDGVYKTRDGGNTWQAVNNGLPWINEESKLAISPSYKVDQTVFAGTTQGLFVTRDRGNSWNKLTVIADNQDSYVEAIAVSPNYQSDRTLMVSLRGKGLFKSVDGGTTFAQVGNDLLNNNHSLANMYGFWPPVTPIQFSPSYSLDRTIYGVSETNIFKSIDGGNTWANMEISQPQGVSPLDLLSESYSALTASPIYKFLAAAILALSSYLILGSLRLEKKLPLKKIQIKVSGAFTAFIILFILFSV